MIKPTVDRKVLVAFHVAQAELAKVERHAALMPELAAALEEMVDQHVNEVTGISQPCVSRAIAILAKIK